MTATTTQVEIASESRTLTWRISLSRFSSMMPSVQTPEWMLAHWRPFLLRQWRPLAAFCLHLLYCYLLGRIECMRCGLLRATITGVCQSVTRLHCANMVKPIEILLVAETFGQPTNMTEIPIFSRIWCGLRQITLTTCYFHKFTYARRYGVFAAAILHPCDSLSRWKRVHGSCVYSQVSSTVYSVRRQLISARRYTRKFVSHTAYRLDQLLPLFPVKLPPTL